MLKKNILRSSLVPLYIIASIIFSFFITHSGYFNYDSSIHYIQSQWLIKKYFFPSLPYFDPNVIWYGPFWELVLGFFTEIVFAPFTNDAHWIRSALNFFLLPLFILGIYKLMGATHFNRATNKGVLNQWGKLFVILFILSNIRLLGHSLFNTKDYPLSLIYTFVIFLLIAFFHLQTKKRFLILLGSLSFLPFLVRVPIILPYLGWILSILFYASRNKKNYSKSWWTTFYISIIFIPLFMSIAFWPTLWPNQESLGLYDTVYQKMFSLFSKFPWNGEVRFFNKTYNAHSLPWRYPFVWWPVIYTPIAFLGITIAVLTWFKRKPNLIQSIFILGTALPYALFLFVKPAFYDEERHFLFVFTPLAVACAFRLLELIPQNFYTWACLILGMQWLSAITGWGKYSYIYKSPLILNRESNQFMGDYWGVCLPEATRALVNLLPDAITANTPVWVISAISPVHIELSRLYSSGKTQHLKNSLIAQDSLNEEMAKSKIVIVHNRVNQLEIPEAKVKLGEWVKIWQNFQPTQNSKNAPDIACAIYLR